MAIKKEKLIRRLFWDLNVDPRQIIAIIDGDSDGDETIRAPDVFYRLLTTYDWYTLLKIVPASRLDHLLDDEVIRKIKSKSLADKYAYARKLLHQ